jgi:hypothetical protein
MADNVWTDTRYDPDLPTTKVAFLSEDYFALAAVHPDLAAALALGERVIVVWEGVAYEVVGADEAGDEFALPATTTTTAGTSAVALGDEPGDGSLPAGVIVAIAAAGLAALGGVTVLVRRRRTADR